jgi:hypothetical protein
MRGRGAGGRAQVLAHEGSLHRVEDHVPQVVAAGAVGHVVAEHDLAVGEPRPLAGELAGRAARSGVEPARFVPSETAPNTAPESSQIMKVLPGGKAPGCDPETWMWALVTTPPPASKATGTLAWPLARPSSRRVATGISGVACTTWLEPSARP